MTVFFEFMAYNTHQSKVARSLLQFN